MKYKLKEIINFNLGCTTFTSNLGKVLNLNESLEFQTPKVQIIEIDENYITLQLLPSEACKIFFTKINEFEDKIKEKFGKEVTSLFNDDIFKVKIKNNNFKIYLNGNLFNLFHLKAGTVVICLVSISKLWINTYDVLNYNLKVNEIVINVIKN